MSRVSGHTEKLWYNETACLWMTIYIYIYRKKERERERDACGVSVIVIGNEFKALMKLFMPKREMGFCG